MPIASTLGTARVGSTWRLLGDVEDIDLDFDLEDLGVVRATRPLPRKMLSKDSLGYQSSASFSFFMK